MHGNRFRNVFFSLSAAVLDNFRMYFVVLAAFAGALLAGCNGGGSGNYPAAGSISYTGKSEQAAITPQNAEAFALEGYDGSAFSSAIGGMSFKAQSAVTTTEAAARQHLSIMQATQALKQSTRSMQLRTPAPHMKTLLAAGSVSTSVENYRIPGDNGGYAEYSLNTNDASGTFSGSVRYYNFSSQGVVVNGTATVAGTLDATLQEITTLTLSFSSLSFSAGNEVFSLTGRLSWTYDAGAVSEKLSMDMLLVYGADPRTYWYHDYLITTTYTDTSFIQSMTGRFYDPDYGYVDCTTGTPIVVTAGDAWPSAGWLQFNGANATWVRLTFSSTALLLQADSDGNGEFDWQDSIATGTPPPPPGNTAPVAEAGPDQNVMQGSTVQLDGSASSDADGNTLSFYWSFQSCPQSSCPSLTGSNTAKPSFIALGSGTYVLRLTVYDGLISSPTDTVSITSQEVTPSDPDLLALQWQYGIFGTSIGAAGLSAVDLDGDGAPEVVTSASGGGYGSNSFWYVLRRTADGGYEQAWRSPVYPSPLVRLAVSDLAGNGALRIVAALSDGTVHIYDAATFAEIKTLSVFASLTDLAIADLDRNGSKELIATNGTAVRVYASDTGELLWSLASGGGASLAVGNVDADQSPEIVTTTYGGKGYVIDAETRTIEWEYLNSFGARVKLGDLDGDGKEEIVGAASWYKITVFDADLKSPAWEIPTNLDIAALLVADADNDGVPEIIYGDGQWGKIHAVDAATHTDKWAVANPSNGMSGLALADVDKDGTREVLWGAGGFLYIANPGTGTIEWQNKHIDGPLTAVAVGDLDDDGKDEILMVSFESESGYAEGIIHIFDAATHALEYQANLGIMDWMGVRSAAIGDVDGDGKTEFVVTTGSLYDGVIQVYDGTSHTLKKQTAAYDSNYFSKIAIGDVDGDGKMEIVAGQGRSTTGATGVYLIVLDGATLQEKWRSVDLGAYWGEVYDIKLADADGDGHRDVVASVGNSKLYVFDGVNHNLKMLTDTPARALEVADVDGDGTPEILAGRNDGSIDVFDGSTFTLKENVFTFSTAPIDALRVANVAGTAGDWIVARDRRLIVMNGSDRSLRWSTPDLSGNIGLHNHVEVREAGGNSSTGIIFGDSTTLYQFE